MLVATWQSAPARVEPQRTMAALPDGQHGCCRQWVTWFEQDRGRPSQGRRHPLRFAAPPPPLRSLVVSRKQPFYQTKRQPTNSATGS